MCLQTANLAKSNSETPDMRGWWTLWGSAAWTKGLTKCPTGPNGLQPLFARTLTLCKTQSLVARKPLVLRRELCRHKGLTRFSGKRAVHLMPYPCSWIFGSYLGTAEQLLAAIGEVGHDGVHDTDWEDQAWFGLGLNVRRASSLEGAGSLQQAHRESPDSRWGRLQL